MRKKRIYESKRTEKCLYDKCQSKEHSRGLCCKHYNRVMVFIKKGLTTWEELEKKGKVRHKLYKRTLNNQTKEFTRWLDLDSMKESRFSNE